MRIVMRNAIPSFLLPQTLLLHTVRYLHTRRRKPHGNHPSPPWHTRRHRPIQVAVRVPGSLEFLDTSTLPLAVGAGVVVILAKLTMMHDESTEQERVERRAKKYAETLGTVRQLSREEWDEIQQLRPRTPFESRIARPNARVRTGEPLRWEDVKDWAIDVLTDALTRNEENLHH
eukprot:c19370_g1_i1 orf=323-844(-)